MLSRRVVAACKPVMLHDHLIQHRMRLCRPAYLTLHNYISLCTRNGVFSEECLSLTSSNRAKSFIWGARAFQGIRPFLFAPGDRRIHD